MWDFTGGTNFAARNICSSSFVNHKLGIRAIFTVLAHKQKIFTCDNAETSGVTFIENIFDLCAEINFIVAQKFYAVPLGRAYSRFTNFPTRG